MNRAGAAQQHVSHKNVRLLYPSDPLVKASPDEAYKEEYSAVLSAGLDCALLSSEDFELGEFKTRPSLQARELILYRGWMLTIDDYTRLVKGIESKNAKSITSINQYRLCHHLPEWYSTCAEFTPETITLSRDADFVSALSQYNWPGYFVKDYVKSLNTGRGSLAQSAKEISEIVSLIEKYRGRVEGGVCVRKAEHFLPESEERYFICYGEVFSRTDEVPPLVQACADRIKSPFFSADVALNTGGELRLVELGDGQVSDRKQWPIGRFVEMLKTMANKSLQPTGYLPQ